MTWHHVAVILIAAVLTIGVVFSPHGEAIGPVFNLDGIIVAGVFGHAGASVLRRRLSTEKEDSRP
jgi:hypothetical protein